MPIATPEIYAEMLAGIRADGTLRFVREAIRMLGSRPREYAEFLERDFTDDSQLKNDLHGLSLALHVSVPSVAAEFEAYVATISPVVEGWLATLKTR